MLDIFGPEDRDDNENIREVRRSMLSKPVQGRPEMDIGNASEENEQPEVGQTLTSDEQEVLNEVYRSVGNAQVTRNEEIQKAWKDASSKSQRVQSREMRML
ncbi:hypothetical protein FGB62_20g22 [Gracilaria domingensis]|nr:hypothetical protein FGB62_20g22 [Gracilaria domingensis]